MPMAPCGVAGDPCAWVCVVCAGGFCDENFELMLLIHELRRRPFLESGGVREPLVAFSELLRLSRAGRFPGIFWGVVGAGPGCACGGGGDARGCVGGAGGAAGGALSCCSRAGRPPCDDVFGSASFFRPGEVGACCRWWWSAQAQALSVSERGPLSAEPGTAGALPLVE